LVQLTASSTKSLSALFIASGEVSRFLRTAPQARKKLFVFF